MTDPLIVRNRLSSVIYHVMSETDGYFTAGMMSDAVIAYLRDVLTPDVLHPAGYDHDGYDLRRRIFGEDE